jgi:hypothetical protein
VFSKIESFEKVSMHSVFFDFKKYKKATEINEILKYFEIFDHFTQKFDLV